MTAGRVAAAVRGNRCHARPDLGVVACRSFADPADPSGRRSGRSPDKLKGPRRPRPLLTSTFLVAGVSPTRHRQPPQTLRNRWSPQSRLCTAMAAACSMSGSHGRSARETRQACPRKPRGVDLRVSRRQSSSGRGTGDSSQQPVVAIVGAARSPSPLRRKPLARWLQQPGCRTG